MSLNICNINDFLYVAIRGCFIKSVFFDLGDKLLKNSIRLRAQVLNKTHINFFFWELLKPQINSMTLKIQDFTSRMYLLLRMANFINTHYFRVVELLKGVQRFPRASTRCQGASNRRVATGSRWHQQGDNCLPEQTNKQLCVWIINRV